jgi:hypothetical protein
MPKTIAVLVAWLALVPRARRGGGHGFSADVMNPGSR